MHGCQQFEIKYGTPSSFTGGKSGNLKHLVNHISNDMTPMKEFKMLRDFFTRFSNLISQMLPKFPDFPNVSQNRPFLLGMVGMGFDR